MSAQQHFVLSSVVNRLGCPLVQAATGSLCLANCPAHLLCAGPGALLHAQAHAIYVWLLLLLHAFSLALLCCSACRIAQEWASFCFPLPALYAFWCSITHACAIWIGSTVRTCTLVSAVLVLYGTCAPYCSSVVTVVVVTVVWGLSLLGAGVLPDGCCGTGVVDLPNG